MQSRPGGCTSHQAAVGYASLGMFFFHTGPLSGTHQELPAENRRKDSNENNAMKILAKIPPLPVSGLVLGGIRRQPITPIPSIKPITRTDRVGILVRSSKVSSAEDLKQMGNTQKCQATTKDTALVQLWVSRSNITGGKSPLYETQRTSNQLPPLPRGTKSSADASTNIDFACCEFVALP